MIPIVCLKQGAVTLGLSLFLVACGGGSSSGGGGNVVDATAPSTPSGLLVSPSSSSLALTWTASTDNVGVQAYELYRDATLVGTTSNTNYTFSGLNPSTSYQLSVRAVDAAGNFSASSAALTGQTSAAAKISYDFSAGDALVNKGGWNFESTSWTLTAVPGGSGMGLPFAFPGVVPGVDDWTEMRFSMPPTDQFWIHLRWHIPSNYLHRHDTYLNIAGAQTAGWQIGDTVQGTDGVSQGTISLVDSTGVYLRFAAKSSWNDVWIGNVSNITRSNMQLSTGRAQMAANNKLLAMWADDYSAHGFGSTIVWQTDLDWPNDTGSHESIITVGYSVGGKTVTGAPASGGVLIGPADVGKYMDIIFNARFSTSPGANDGIIRTFVRKQGESTYTMRHNITNANMDKRSDVAPNLQQWQAGYLMGWSNSGYDTETTFHLSQIEYFDSLPSELIGISP